MWRATKTETLVAAPDAFGDGEQTGRRNKNGKETKDALTPQCMVC
jgi:hypothetical protein